MMGLMMKRSTIVLLAIAIGSLFAACKKTEEGESRQWKRSLEDLGGLSVTYPGFKAALQDLQSKAERAMDEAIAVADKEARIEAMAKANRMLSTGFTDGLRKADDRIKKLRKRLVDLAGSAATDAEKLSLAEAKTQVEKAIESAETKLRQGASDVATAATVVKNATKDLDFARDALKGVSDRISARVRSEKNAKAAQVDKEAAAAQAEEAKVAPWTCEYCSHENPHDAAKCSNCGAPKGGKAEPEKATK